MKTCRQHSHEKYYETIVWRSWLSMIQKEEDLKPTTLTHHRQPIAMGTGLFNSSSMRKRER